MEGLSKKEIKKRKNSWAPKHCGDCRGGGGWRWIGYMGRINGVGEKNKHILFSQTLL